MKPTILSPILIGLLTTLAGAQQDAPKNAQPAPDAGLVGWWKLNEGSGEVARDTSVSGNIGKINNPVWITGPNPNSKALQIKPGSWVEFSRQQPLVDQLTVMFRVMFDPAVAPFSVEGYPDIVYYGKDGDISYAAGMSKDGVMTFSTSTEGSRHWQNLKTTNDTWEAGKWYHYAVTYDTTARKMICYVDGVEQSSAEYYEPIFKGYANWKLYFGVPTGWGYQHKAFSGALSDVKIYQRALSAGEIKGASEDKGASKPGS